MFKRIIFIVIAGLFLFTSLGFSLLVIWEMRKEGKESQANQQTQTTNQLQPKEGKLEGTKLKDFTPTSTPKLQTTDTVVGTGDEVKATDTVTVHYTGAVAATGIIFQSSLDMGQPVSFPLNQVIPGW